MAAGAALPGSVADDTRVTSVFVGGCAFIFLPVMIFSSSDVTYPRSSSDWKIFPAPSSTRLHVRVDHHLGASAGGSYGSVMPMKLGISPPSAFL